MAIVYDSTNDPFHVMVYPRHHDYVELDRVHDELETFLLHTRKPGPAVLISDLRVAPTMDARSRARVAKCFARLAPAIGKHVLAHGLVLRGRIARGALTAVLWLHQPPWPMQTFGTMEEADGWLRSRCREAGVALPFVGPTWWAAAVKRAHSAVPKTG